MTSNISSQQRRLIGHGAILIFIGGILGFGFLFFLIGKIALWPIPWELKIQLPGTYDSWRMAHMEGITNGFGLWLMAAVLPLLNFSAKTSRRIAIGMIITAWTIVIASTFDPLFPDSRGLSLTQETSLTNDIAFLLFLVGLAIVIAIMLKIAHACLFSAKR